MTALPLISALDELVSAVQGLDASIDAYDVNDQDALIEAWWYLDHPADGPDEGGMCQRLAKLRDALRQKAAGIMASAGETTRVTDLGVVHQSKPPKPKGFDNERLLRDVLDSRLVDPLTGEVMEETPADKIRAIWNLSGHTARKIAMEERGLDLVKYAEDPDWQPPTIRWAR